MDKFLFSLGLVAAFCCGTLGYAEEIEKPVSSIEIKATRERLVPYQESYEIAKKVHDASNGRVALALRLVPAKPEVQVNDLQLWLEGGTESIPIKILEGGVFVVPINDLIAEQKGHYSINKKKGDLTARIVVLPAIAKNDWTIGLMEQVVVDAKNAIAKFTPWYQRPFAMRVDSVAVCSKEAGAMVQVMNGNTLIANIPTDKKALNDIGIPVFCKYFNNENKFDRNFNVLIPEAAEVLLL